MQIKAYQQKVYLIKNHSLLLFIKCSVILIIVFEVIFTSLNNNFANRTSEKFPEFIGAYALIKNENSTTQIKKCFIHKSKYLIFQSQNDEMQDFRLEILNNNKQFLLNGL